jgi:hypothetical protein
MKERGREREPSAVLLCQRGLMLKEQREREREGERAHGGQGCNGADCLATPLISMALQNADDAAAIRE